MSSRKSEREALAAPWHQSPRAQFLLPFLLAMGLTLPFSQGPLVWDDVMLLRDDAFVHSLANIPAAFLRSFWAGVTGTRSSYDYYRPFTTVTYILNYAVSGGGWSGPFHIVNSLLYAATAGLLALAVMGAGAGAGVALASGLLFAAWPTHHENVDFISGRTDVLAGLLLVAAFVMLRRARANPAQPLRLVWLMLASAGAIFSKEVAYLAPLAALLAEWAWGLRKDSWLRIGACAAPLLGALPLRQLALAHRIHAPLPPPAFALSALLVNTRTLLCPWPLHVNHFVPQNWSSYNYPMLGAWAAFFVLTLLLSRGRVERALWLAGWLFMFPGCLTGISADRMQYVPTLAFLPWGAMKLSRLPWSGAARAALCGLVVAALSAGLLVRGSIWASDRNLFESQVQESPWDPTAHDQLGNVYHRLANLPDVPDSSHARLMRMALEHSRFSVFIDSNAAPPSFDYARNLLTYHEDSLALVAVRRGLRHREDARARLIESQALAGLSRWREADSAASRGLRQEAGTKDGNLWATLGWVRFKQARWEDAARLAGRATQVDSTLIYAAYNRALALGAAGKADSAAALYGQLLSAEHDGATALTALGDLCDFAEMGGPHSQETLAGFLKRAGLEPSREAASLSPALQPRLAGGAARARRLLQVPHP